MASYGDDEARRIIERALEIDADERGKLDGAKLRVIAANAGISPMAVERALREHELMNPSRLPWYRRYATAIVIAAIIAALALLMVMREVIPGRF